MRYLISSLVLVVFVSCASYPKKKGFTETVMLKKKINNPYFSDTKKDYVYKANIDAFGNSLGGIYIIKKINENHHRVAFTTEMGNKIFDFTFHGENFKVNHILKKMDKKILIDVLKNDFRVLIKEKISIEKAFQKESNFIYKTKIKNKKYYYFLSEEQLNKIIRIGHGKEKVEFTFSEINDNIVQQIQILHKNFKLKIVLKAI